LKTLDFTAAFAKPTFHHLSLDTAENRPATTIEPAPPSVRCNTARYHRHLVGYTVSAAQSRSTPSKIQISNGDEGPVRLGGTAFLRFQNHDQ
jgi:hypothetical protein